MIRSEKTYIDDRPEKDGVEEVVVDNVKKLDFEYWDRQAEDWTDSWDAELDDLEAQTAALSGASGAAPGGDRALGDALKVLTGSDDLEEFELPPRVKIRLELWDDEEETYIFETEAEIHLRHPFEWGFAAVGTGAEGAQGAAAAGGHTGGNASPKDKSSHGGSGGGSGGSGGGGGR